MDGGIETLTEGLDEPVRELVARLRELVSEVVPDALEELDLSARMVGYTYRPGTYRHLIAAITPHTAHVNLMLATGAQLTEADPHGLLAGTGKKARHITFRAPDDVDRPGVRELLAEAARRTPRP